MLLSFSPDLNASISLPLSLGPCLSKWWSIVLTPSCTKMTFLRNWRAFPISAACKEWDKPQWGTRQLKRCYEEYKALKTKIVRVGCIWGRWELMLSSFYITRSCNWNLDNCFSVAHRGLSLFVGSPKNVKHTFVQRRLCTWKNKTESCSLWSDWHDWALLSSVLQALWLVSIHPFQATVCNVELFCFGRSSFPLWLVGLCLLSFNCFLK